MALARWRSVWRGGGGHTWGCGAFSFAERRASCDNKQTARAVSNLRGLRMWQDGPAAKRQIRRAPERDGALDQRAHSGGRMGGKIGAQEGYARTPPPIAPALLAIAEAMAG